MKTKLLLCFALFAFSISASARAVRIWSDAELMKSSDLVILARPISSRVLDETNSLGYSQFGSFHGFRGVETTFKALDVLKGMPANDHIILHHYLEDFSPVNGPTFISFASGDTNKYLLYLAKDGPNRYVPAAGQIDPGLSIQRPKSGRNAFDFDFPVIPPAADANPAVRHAVQVHIPIQLRAQRLDDAMVIKADEMMATNLMVGSNVFTGTSIVTHIYSGGKRVAGTDSMQSGFTDGSCDETFRRALGGVPVPGHKYSVVVRLTLFETDEPPQHEWDPGEGNYYKVLYEEVLTVVAR